MLYLYGIIDRPCARPPLPPGFGEVEPDIFEHQGLGAVAGFFNGGAPPADSANVRRHMAVLDALMLTGRTVLPARFGSMVSGREELNAFISGSRETLQADLNRLRGQIELGVRASDCRPQALNRQTEADEEPGPADGAPPGPGARYLAVRQAEAGRRASRKRALGALAASILEPLSPLVTTSAWQAPPSPPGRLILSLALLLRRERLEAFRLALAQLRRSRPWLEILCTGPWPPYSFVSGVEVLISGGKHVHSGEYLSAI